MKTNHFLIIVLTILAFNCKSDKKTPKLEEPKIVVEKDTVSKTPIDTIQEIIKDTIPVIEEVKPKVIAPKKEKAAVSPPKKKSTQNFIVDSDIKITPIEHATMVMEYNGMTIYIDPVGGQKAFEGFKAPNFILITDIHGDHLDVETLKAINKSNTVIIGPKAVKNKLSGPLLKNFTTIFSGLSRSFNTSKMSLNVEGIDMYNIRKEALKYHPKGRGVGYVLTINKKRIYISGDTEDTFEMRHLKNIDIAFVCMNLPWTMPVENAASAVLDFKPRKVLPYHYKGSNGFSDIKKFKSLVNKGNKRINVIQLDWYN